MDDNWPFDQPQNCAVITLKQIIDGAEPILHVSHDLDDHGWQFLGIGDACEEDAAVVCLGEIVKSDSTVLQVADIPPGWHAWRQTVADKWTREPNPYDIAE